MTRQTPVQADRTGFKQRGFFDQHGTWIPQAAERCGPAAAQAMFRALFDHEPRIDIRTPAQVRAQALAEGWRRA
jgi:hypothetical protein